MALTRLKKKILIVEDHPDLVNFYKQVAILLGCDSIVAMTGKQAVDVAVAELPDLILLDIMLPEMDGLEAARRIRKNAKAASIPILVLTGVTYKDEEIRQCGCNDYIVKPFTVNHLVSRIKKLLK